VQWLLLILAGVMYGSGTVMIRFGTRRRTTTWGLSLWFSLVPCAIATVIGLPYLDTLRAEYAVWPILLGAMVVVAIWATAEALRHGPIGPVFLVRSGSIALPVTASILIYGEPFGVCRAMGLAIAAVAMVLLTRTSPEPRRDGQRQRSWVAYALLGLICVGMVQVIMRDAVSRDAVSREVSAEFLLAFIMLTYWGNVAAAVAGLAVSRHKPTRADMLWGTLAGLTSLVGFSVSMFVLRKMDGVLVFPSRFLIIATVVICSGFVLFKERPDRRTALGMVLGILGIVLLAIKPG
jgi:drug/metabolite transporter (DMT)-like permease